MCHCHCAHPHGPIRTRQRPGRHAPWSRHQPLRPEGQILVMPCASDWVAPPVRQWRHWLVATGAPPVAMGALQPKARAMAAPPEAERAVQRVGANVVALPRVEAVAVVEAEVWFAALVPWLEAAALAEVAPPWPWAVAVPGAAVVQVVGVQQLSREAQAPARPTAADRDRVRGPRSLRTPAEPKQSHLRQHLLPHPTPRPALRTAGRWLQEPP